MDMAEDYEIRLRQERFGLAGDEPLTGVDIRELPPVRNLKTLQLPPAHDVVYRGLQRLNSEEHRRRARLADEFISGN